ncbi:NAD-dependent epimerase/dehydratase family protein [Halorhabdus sp. CBA1104]|uniref:NAD-dependent epimerase/dehydratase family protein n=1 Tax=Halorhabdus sp. CBA1104 TaxID=1380432 RepID=UPI0012B3D33C|nr:NAD-dependent epimerase/dehydratase family protein [Halorhabdus sp. CBA1104]QGN07252.1 NAD-dependent epimerase/dehydratase family protein [Halorhabdus sp. CBA1104]
MELTDKRILVTGGAGLIGSALARRLVTDNDVVVVDDLSNGIEASVPDDATFIEGDLTNEGVVAKAIDEQTDIVFHLAADKYVNAAQPREQFETNGEMTYNLLERMAAVGVEHIAFTSSSTVYGEAPRPTPEDYAPLEPISEYGAAKLSEESLLSVYAHSHDFTVWNFRFANIVGPRYGAGVVPDFIYKLSEDPETLTIRGNGRQEKSYMTLTECIDAMCYVVEHADQPVNTYNLGTRTTTSVNRIADIVADEMGVDPDYEYTGGDRGWDGDVPKMRLSIEKLAALGWEPSTASDQAIRNGVQEILDGAENEPHLS